MSSSKQQPDEETVFMGLRVSKDIHQRLYRAKARLELEIGKFYGMGRLLDKVLRIGLVQIEKELGDTSASVAASSV